MISFKDVLQEQQLAAVKSNLSNLAHAHIMLEEDIVSLIRKITDLRNIQKEIEMMGEKDPATLHVSEVKELYDRSKRMGKGY